jgi:hypothetical protein
MTVRNRGGDGALWLQAPLTRVLAVVKGAKEVRRRVLSRSDGSASTGVPSLSMRRPNGPQLRAQARG